MLIKTVERIIRTRPGITATQIAGLLYGVDGYQERIDPVCRSLWALGRVLRSGAGRPGDPYRYFAAAAIDPKAGDVRSDRGRKFKKAGDKNQAAAGR